MQTVAAGKNCVVLSADDYGLTPGVSAGIRQLLLQKRLTATAAMTISPFWAEEGRRLLADWGRVDADVGLHLTLTDHVPLTRMPRLARSGRLPGNGPLILMSLRGQLKDDAIRRELAGEIAAQIDAFEAVMGRVPDFMDGHHHCHQLPVIRDLVLEAFGSRIGTEGGYLRLCQEPLPAILQRGRAVLRAAVINALGQGFARKVRKAGLKANDSFRGVRDFTAQEDTGDLFRRFFKGAGDRPLVMCHPGYVDDHLIGLDPLTDLREVELQYLASDAFAMLLAENDVALVRFKDLAAA
ncbi:ChbG/HpnK family deacetylase [Pannonibacter carbonis]|uniref:ChbG/HpnK family deacetylase n=1 Tax=Pannonibacter carbonis TaxID=2067569 RepID=UPI000D1092E0|nr:ChbG/HpnK family deacetylase [Pannonibacter carbonis]